MLKEQRPEIVSVCTPDSTHYELIRAVLCSPGVRGVLAEKPLALEVEEAEELVELARSHSVVLAVNYSRRYSIPHVRLRDFIRSGRLGCVHLVLGLFTNGTLHNGTHWFDLVRFLVGEVDRVKAADRLREAGADPTLDVSLTCRGGALARLHACSMHDFTIFEMDLIGTRGRVRLTESCDVMETFGVVDGVPYAGYRGLVLRERTEGSIRDVLLTAVEDLVQCLDIGRQPQCTGEDGVQALRIALAARDAAASGAGVEWGLAGL
jgi:predicted dehydrogenase